MIFVLSGEVINGVINTMRTTKRFKLMLVAGAASAAMITNAYAQATEADGVSLASALNNLAAESDFEILFEPDMVAGFTARPYEASASSLETLNAMLADAGLSATEAAPRVFVVAQIEQEAPVEPDEPTTPSGVTAQPLPASAGAGATGPLDGASDPGVISGRVVDDGTGNALIGAKLTLIETGQTAATDRRGNYRFGAVLPGTYTLSIDYLGTETTAVTVIVEADEISVIDVRVPYFLDTVFVRSSRSSLSQALNKQRTAENNTTVVSSDLLGNFPAENVSEALRRVSGVAFSRDTITGEGEFITVRGFDSEAINIKLNGLQLNGTGVDRSIDLSGIQGENIAEVTINKTLLPSQESNSSGGLVEIETKSGLDYGDQYFSFGLEREFGDDSKFGEETELNATAAYKFTDNFGVVAVVQYRDTDRFNLNANPSYITIPVRPEGITLSSQIPSNLSFPFDIELPDPLQLGASYLVRDREETNLTGSLSFEWDVASHTSLRLDLQRNEQEQTFEERRSTQRVNSSSSLSLPVEELGGEIRRRTRFTSYAPSLGIAEQESETTTNLISFRGTSNLGQWDLDYKLGYTETVRETRRDNVTIINDNSTDIFGLFDSDSLQTVVNPATNIEYGVDGVFGLQADNVSVPNFSAAGTAYAFDGSRFYVSSANRQFNRQPVEEWTASSSARYNFIQSFMDYLEGGFKFTTNERANSDDNLSNTTLSTLQSYSRSSFAASARTYVTDFGQSIDPLGLGFIGVDNFDIPLLASGSASDYIDQIDALTVDDPDTAENEQRFRLSDREGLDPIENSTAASPLTITEDRFGGYLQAGATIGKFDFVGGGRFESIDASSTSLSTPSVRRADGRSVTRADFVGLGLVQQFDSSSSNETFTPTIIANYRPQSNVVVRATWQQTTTNPNVAQIARPFQVVVDNRPDFNRAGIREANPDLQASVADNFELDFSYYFQENPGLIRLGLFYKDIENNFTNDIRADEPTQLDVASRVLDELAPLLASEPDAFAFDDETVFFIQRPRNGEGGVIYGVEFEAVRQLDFLPDTWPSFLENFRLGANLTWTDSDFPTDVTFFNGITRQSEIEVQDVPLAGNVEWSGTASVSYEDGPFSGTLLYSGQSEEASSYNVFDINAVIPEYDTLDLRLQYRLDSVLGGTTIYLEGDNLLAGSETADVGRENSSFGGQSTSVDFAYPTIVQFNGGRTYTVGAKVVF